MFKRNKQKFRKSCLGAIQDKYPGSEPALMAERIGSVYYSVWRIAGGILEVIKDQGEISIYQYVDLEKSQNISA